MESQRSDKTQSALLRFGPTFGLTLILLCLLAPSFAQELKKPIYQSPSYKLYSDAVMQGEFLAQAHSSKEITSNYKSPFDYTRIAKPYWRLTLNIKAYPQYTSNCTLANALYNLSLEEMIKDIEEDSTFRTGKEWAGVWTRDISYSIFLSMAALQPNIAKYSLLKKVKGGCIIQDMGTGGSYPVSTDRMVWAIAAWEVYKVTGDYAWLRQSYAIIKKSLEEDQHNIMDFHTGLAKGESSFLDWREQTYPGWMEPADIFESECLGTNAVHYQANCILSKMAMLLKDSTTSKQYLRIAERIKLGINQFLWLEKGYYGQYIYGRNYKVISPRAEALGEALCVLFDIADASRSKQIISSTPTNEYGIPCIYPQTPNVPPYHNNAIWPFVEAYWALASAKARNEKSVSACFASLYRASALFLTNKENFMASNGDYMGTQINSDNMLWSLSGNLSLVYKVLFGIQFNEKSMTLTPLVPEMLKGHHLLKNFKYRGAVLSLEIEGFGDKPKSVTIDGILVSKAEIPATLHGCHNLKIVLSNNKLEGPVCQVENYIAPETPKVTLKGNALTWMPEGNNMRYKIIQNGVTSSITDKTCYAIQDNHYGVYQIITIDPNGYASFASEPVVVYPSSSVSIYELEDYSPTCKYAYQGFSGKGFVETSLNVNPTLKISAVASQAGEYIIDFRYANGNGPITTGDKCGIRTLKVNGYVIGAVVFPQRGVGEWSNWGFSNSYRVYLHEGLNVVSLIYEPENINMHEKTNQAMIDYMRIIKIK